MKRIALHGVCALLSLAVATVIAVPVTAQVPAIGAELTLDSCRNMALRNNKTLQIAAQTVQQAQYVKKAARGAYLPAIDFAGGYIYNQKAVQLVDVDALRGTATGLGIPQSVAALIPDDLLRYDTHNVAAGAVTVTQPIFMGGKIKALNDVAREGERLAQSQYRLTEENVVAAVDDAYWLVVSLEQKCRLAQRYVELIDTLHSDVEVMIAEGVATPGELLTVDVALNEAEIALVKAQNGESLARMLLAQLCGMPIDTPYTLQTPAWEPAVPVAASSLDGVYSRREELRSLGYLSRMAQAQERVSLSSMLPQLAVVGAYTFNTPHLYNGFKNEVDGMFRVGVVMRVPICHWGTHLYKHKAAHSATVISQIEMDAARERIALQVRQATYRAQEAEKSYALTCRNSEKADENLRNARLAFDEGVYTATEVRAAQVAWEKAQSERIDAYIALQTGRNNLLRVLGETTY